MFLHLCVILFTGGLVGFPACITGHMTRGSASRGLEGLHLWGSASGGRLGRPPQDTWDTIGYGQQEGGTHPTGMNSCIIL